MSVLRSVLLMGMWGLLWTLPVHGNSFNFTVTGSGTNPADGNKLSASAQFAFLLSQPPWFSWGRSFLPLHGGWVAAS